MGVKDSVRYLEKLKEFSVVGLYGDRVVHSKGMLDDCITDIKEGDKWKRAFKEVEEFLNPGGIIEVSEDDMYYDPISAIRFTMKRIKEKYFPEPKLKDTPGRFILDKIEEAIKNFLQEIYHIKAE
ncbi:unnamed protein product, partial [marine sediment metagenome]